MIQLDILPYTSCLLRVLPAHVLTPNSPRIMHFNAIFGKVGRIASEEVIVQLFKSKCLLILYYGLEVCHYTKSRISALQYVVTSFFGKILNTRSKDIISDCMYFF